jgi:hypothetical protein
VVLVVVPGVGVVTVAVGDSEVLRALLERI